MDDDIFDDEDELTIAERSYKRMRGALLKDGFREGVSVGQEQLLQKGFNDGFKMATGISFQLAKLRGILSAHIGQCLSQHKQETEHLPTLKREKLEELLESVAELEEKWIKSTVLPTDKRIVDIKSETRSIQGDTGCESHKSVASSDAGSAASQCDAAKPACENAASQCGCGDSGGCGCGGGKTEVSDKTGKTAPCDTTQPCDNSVVEHTDVRDDTGRPVVSGESMYSDIERLKRTLAGLLDE